MPWWGTSNECPQYMFSTWNKKTINTFQIKKPLFWSVVHTNICHEKIRKILCGYLLLSGPMWAPKHFMPLLSADFSFCFSELMMKREMWKCVHHVRYFFVWQLTKTCSIWRAMCCNKEPILLLLNALLYHFKYSSRSQDLEFFKPYFSYLHEKCVSLIVCASATVK